MSKPILETIIIKINEKFKERAYRSVSDTIYDSSFDVTISESPSDNYIEFNIDEQVPVSFELGKFLNSLHNTTEGITSVVAINGEDWNVCFSDKSIPSEVLDIYKLHIEDINSRLNYIYSKLAVNLNIERDEVVLTTDDPDEDYQGNEIIVIDDVYEGKYSGHLYTAWVRDVPRGASDDPAETTSFWKNNKVIYGGGKTPDEAVAALFEKLLHPEYPVSMVPKVIIGRWTYDKEIEDIHRYAPMQRGPDTRFRDSYPLSFEVFSRLWWRMI